MTEPPPLPPLRLDWDSARHDVRTQTTEATRVRLQWGSLRIGVDQATLSKRANGSLLIDGQGRVELQRGTETLSARSIRFDTESATFTVDDASVVIAPLRIRSSTLERRSDGVTLRNFRLEAAQAGRAELRIDAPEARYSPQSDKIELREARFLLFGKPLVTLPRVAFSVGLDDRQEASRLEFPLTWRQSTTSGLATGFRVPLPGTSQTRGRAIWETTTQRGTQWLVDIEHRLSQGKSRRRRLFSDVDASDASPIRRLTSTPEPERRIPVYNDFLTLPELIVAPRDRFQINTGITWQARREFVRRDAVVLISRAPQIRLQAHYPFGDAFIEGEASLGRIREDAPRGGFAQADRRAWLLRAAAPPVPLSQGLRLQVQGSVNDNHYFGQSNYRVVEGRFALDSPLGGRNGLAAGVVARRSYGSTPFLFDLVEAGTEGQLRGQFQFHRLLTAFALRWDMGQRRLFDREIGVGWQGNLLEPRLTWRSQGRQLSFSIVVASLNL